MPPLEPLYVSLPWACLVLALGWQPWRREAAARRGPIASALAVAGGWFGAWAAALGLPALPPVNASERLSCAILLTLLLAPLEARRRPTWVAVGWLALATAFAQRTLPAFARGRHWEGSETVWVVIAAVVVLALARLATGRLVARFPRGPLVPGAFGLSLLAAGIAQGLGGSIGLATGFAGAAVGACAIAGVALLLPAQAMLRAGASSLAMTHAGGIGLALFIVPGFSLSSAGLLALAPYLAALPIGDPQRFRGWFPRALAVLALDVVAVWIAVPETSAGGY
jgi:hypothetical protein